MPIHFEKPYRLLLPLLMALLLSACNSKDEEINDDEVIIDIEPAYEALLDEGTLYTIEFRRFDNNAGVDNDDFSIRINEFSPAQTNEILDPDDDDVDQTDNDLGWSQDFWDEDSLSWRLYSSAPAQDSSLDVLRSYRLLDGDKLKKAVTTKNAPVYEAIEENVIERHLGTTFVWDIDGYNDFSATVDVSGDDLEDFENYNSGGFNLEVLPFAETWAGNYEFNEGAIIYGATRSVNDDVVIVEAVHTGSGFSLDAAKITQGGIGKETIEQALAPYTPAGGQRLEYKYTVDYINHYSVFIVFDFVEKTATLYSSASSFDPEAPEAPLIISDTQPYIEIDTTSLNLGERALFNFTGYFLPAIIGPFTEDGSDSANPEDKYFYMGKRYIKTEDDFDRVRLEPLFFFNPIAIDDIKDAFALWRTDEHLDAD